MKLHVAGDADNADTDMLMQTCTYTHAHTDMLTRNIHTCSYRHDNQSASCNLSRTTNDPDPQRTTDIHNIHTCSYRHDTLTMLLNFEPIPPLPPRTMSVDAERSDEHTLLLLVLPLFKQPTPRAAGTRSLVTFKKF